MTINFESKTFVEIDEKYEEVLTSCNAKSQKHTDAKFPITRASLIDPGVTPPGPEWDGIEWIRADEIPELNDEDGELAVFAGAIDPDDIKQGGLGDCYYLCVLAALTEKPERIQRLIDVEKTNDKGIWAVTLYKNGVAQEIIMDNYIPCRDGRPCFSRANGNELWVLMMEKAWAKVHGTYERIEAGQCSDAMRDLTGAPSYSLNTVEDPDVEANLLVYDQMDYVMAASCSADDPALQQEYE